MSSPSPAELARQNDDLHSGGEYETYESDNNYDYDTGMVVLPVAGRTPAFRNIRLHGGYGMRVVKFRAIRKGKPPVIPQMVDTSYDTFLKGEVIVSLPVQNPQSGAYTFEAHGKYVFVQTSPRIVGTNTLPTGGYPYPLPATDQMAAQLAQPVISNASSFLSSPNPNDMAAQSLSSIVISPDGNYAWLFTMIPPIYSSETLISG